MPAIPFAASAAPLSWTPPSVAALKPAVCIAAKSVEVYRKTPRVPELGADGRLGGGAGLGDGDELGVGAELGVGVGAGGGGAAPLSNGRMSPTFESAAWPSNATP